MLATPAKTVHTLPTQAPCCSGRPKDGSNAAFVLAAARGTGRLKSLRGKTRDESSMTEKGRSDLPDPVHLPPFRIENCLVLPALNRIECGQETHQIEPRVMQVLVCLASRPNEVLSRQMLFDLVWADTVVCEEALTRTISELRRVFRDDTKTPRVIETIRKGGYRLIAPITPAVEAGPSKLPAPSAASAIGPVHTPTPFQAPAAPAPYPPPDQAPTPTPPQSPLRIEPSTPRSRRWSKTARLLGVVGLTVLAILFTSLWGMRRFGRPIRSGPALGEPVPLTSFPGLELFPSLSPDGSTVAFSWAGEKPGPGNPLDIYIMQCPDGSPVRLTSLPGSEVFPSWSPDGAEIVFAGETPEGHEICAVAVLGGEVRRLAAVDSPISGLDWSPDGRTIAYAAAEPSGAITRIHLLSLESLSRHELTSSAEHCLAEGEPVISPDGRFVAFIRVNGALEQDTYFVPIEGGEARKVDMEGRRVSGVDWLSKQVLLVSAASKVDAGLWAVRTDSGERVRLSIPGGKIQRVSLSRTGKHLTYEKISYARNIWCVDVSRTGVCRPREEPLIASTQRDSEPVVSPDGRMIAFVSDRSGSPEIWIADSTVGNARRLTDHQATQTIRPRWSPDGARIAYSCNAGGLATIYVTELRSKASRRLLQDGSQTLAIWARHGDYLYYQVDTPGGWEAWRVHSDGGDRRKVGEAGTTIIDETSDGRGLLCLRSNEPGIWLLPIDGGSMSLVVPAEECADWQEVVAARDGLYFTRRGAETSTLGFYDFATGHSDSLATLQWYAASFALSPDGSMLLYDCIGGIEVDLMVADILD